MTDTGYTELTTLDPDTAVEVNILYNTGRGIIVRLELSNSYLSYDTDINQFEEQRKFTPSKEVCCARCDTHKFKDKQWYKILNKRVLYSKKRYQKPANTTSEADETTISMCPRCYTEIITHVNKAIQENKHIIVSQNI